MSIADDISQAEQYLANLYQQHQGIADMLLNGLSAIASLTSSSTAETAVDTVKGVEAILSALGHGLAGRVTPDDVQKHIDELGPALQAMDAKHLAELQARFAAKVGP